MAKSFWYWCLWHCSHVCQTGDNASKMTLGAGRQHKRHAIRSAVVSCQFSAGRQHKRHATRSAAVSCQFSADSTRDMPQNQLQWVVSAQQADSTRDMLQNQLQWVVSSQKADITRDTPQGQLQWVVSSQQANSTRDMPQDQLQWVVNSQWVTPNIGVVRQTLAISLHHWLPLHWHLALHKQCYRVTTSLVMQNSMYFPGYFQIKAMKFQVNLAFNQCLYY